MFANTVLDLGIVAFAIFVLVRQVNRMTRREDAPPAAPTTKDGVHCLSTIPIKATRCAYCTARLEAA